MATLLRRSIFIGLGGTGMKTILRTKAVLLDNYGQNGELPPFFSFLGIDTDAGEYDKTITSRKMDNLGLLEREKFSISVADPVDYFEYERKEMRWMPHQNEGAISTLDTGAGQVRSNGRLAFMFNLQRLKDRLRKAITDTCNASGYSEKWENYKALDSGVSGKTKIEVHVIFSLCGGTGSGTFLDVAYLLRELEKETNYIITLNGYAVLPGVFIEQIRDPTERSRVQPNAYGALRELDYLMSMVRDERKVKISWQKKETNQPPFDSLVLVDNRNTMGITYGEMENLTEMLSLALLATTGQIGTDSKSVGDNVKIDTRMKAFDVDSKCAWVAAIGTSTIMFDSENVAKVYELKAQNKLLHDLLDYSEDKNNIANNWIDAATIRENRGEDQVINALCDVSKVMPMTLTAQDLGRQTAKADLENKLNIYSQNYIPSPEEWTAKIDSLFTSTCAKLVEKEKELSTKSIGLVYDFLKEVRDSVNDIFIPMMNDEREKECEDERKQAQGELESRVAQLADHMKKIIRTGTNNYISLFINAARAHVVAELEIKRRSSAALFYARLVEFIDAEMRNASETIEKMKAIIAENDAQIRKLQNRVGSKKTVVIDLAEEVIKNVELSEEDSLLTSGLLEKMPNQSLYGEVSKTVLREQLEEYTRNLHQCQAYRARTIDHIIEEMSLEELKKYVQRAYDYSQPFLTIDSKGRKLKNGRSVGEQEIFYICVPDKTSCRLTKDGLYRDMIKAEMATPISTGLTDRIIIYRQKRPVPAFAIGGLSVLQMPYDAEQEIISFHIDQLLQQRMDEEHYDFEPQRLNQDEAVDAWVMGCILGFIKFDKGSYWYQDLLEDSITNDKENWVNTQTAFREEAFKLFSENELLIKKYMDVFRQHLDDIGLKAKEELRQEVEANYFKRYSRCQLTEKMLKAKKEYKETLQLIELEQKHKGSIFTD